MLENMKIPLQTYGTTILPMRRFLTTFAIARVQISSFSLIFPGDIQPAYKDSQCFNLIILINRQLMALCIVVAQVPVVKIQEE